MSKLINQLKDLYPEVDYQALMAQMQNQSHPRRKLKELQEKGFLIRLKKGFYVLTYDFIGKNYSPQIIANLLYGPSYLSLEYALSYYSLIPERVEVLTSVTTQKNKTFDTQVGHFSFTHLASAIYPIGVSIESTQDNRFFIIATPEKALMDIFSLRYKNSDSPKSQDIQRILTDDLRIDLDIFEKNMNRKLLQEMLPLYKNRIWNQRVIKYLLENL